eukprot:gene26910-25218_t
MAIRIHPRGLLFIFTAALAACDYASAMSADVYKVDTYSQTCASTGGATIATAADCEAAAVTLGLKASGKGSLTASKHNDDIRPPGCFWFDYKYDNLEFNSNLQSQGTGGGSDSVYRGFMMNICNPPAAPRFGHNKRHPCACSPGRDREPLADLL